MTDDMRYTVTLIFQEPFRLWPVTASERRERLFSGREHHLKEFNYAHLVKIRGRLYPALTGTLLRSRVLREVEEILARSNGSWMDRDCCPGRYLTAGHYEGFRRRRATPGWEIRREICSSVDNRCTLCALLGNHDPGKGAESTVRFGNLLPDEDWFNGLDSKEELSTIGRQRICNRRDLAIGKAGDTWPVFEVDRIRQFTGCIDINPRLDQDQHRQVHGLLKNGLAMVQTISGGACAITISKNTEEENTVGPEAGREVPGTETVVQGHAPGRTQQQAMFADLGSQIACNRLGRARLRELADAILALRGRNPVGLQLPRGTIDHKGNQRNHFLWDEIQVDGRPIRDLIGEVCDDLATHTGEEYARTRAWRIWCETTGNGLHRIFKEGNAPPTSGIRPLGAAHQFRQPDNPQSWSEKSRVISCPTHEWIITGWLQALTPFHCGDPGMADEQVDIRVLLDRDFSYRIPHSALRGALREDLHAGSNGRGCSARLGQERPCQCPVCRTLQRVRMLDTTSDTLIPPDVRQRIRRNVEGGIVDEGALFNMEVAPQGARFPFVLRWRGGSKLENNLEDVLTWWRDGYCFIGGQTGTGKGRFALVEEKIWRWDLLAGRHEYTEYTGLRQLDNDVLALREKLAGLTEEFPDKVQFVTLPDVPENSFPLTRISCSFSFTSPVLLADPVAALVQRQDTDSDRVSDAVFFRKTVVDEQGMIHSIPALKGESIRGLWRQAVGRAGEGARGRLLLQDHSECDCPLCSLFGNEHQRGKLRFEDLELSSDSAGDTKVIDHVSLDRAFNSVVQKYDAEPYIGAPGNEVVFKGTFWHAPLSGEEQELLRKAFQDIRDGLYPVGGRGGTGLGWVERLEISGDNNHFLNTVSQDVQSRPDRTASTAPVDASEQEPESGRLCYPYYFLKPCDTFVKRIRRPVRHAILDPTRRTGRIRCRLNILTPLIVPDTSQNDFFALTNICPEHRSHGFFQLHNRYCIPGSTIRGMISSVYEALTNSCFRIMNQKEILTRRMEADDAKFYKPGRVINNGSEIKPMKQARLPIYDDPDCTEEIENSPQAQELFNGADQDRREKINAACLFNRQVADIADDNRALLDAFGQQSADYLKRLLTGREQIRFKIRNDVGNINDPIAQILPLDSREGQMGFVKFTGPNNANTENCSEDDENYNEAWRPLRYNFRLDDTDGELRNSQKKPYPRPVKTFIFDGKKYTLSKRCERIFYNDPDNSTPIPIPAPVRAQYKEILEAYENNTDQIAKPVRTFFQHHSLRDGDLVYYRESGEGSERTVEAIIPVAISRSADPHPLGARLSHEALRPCAHICLEEEATCATCTAKTCNPALYREGYPVNGLCPACYLFGTTGYKGRLRFGYGFFDNLEFSEQQRDRNNTGASLGQDITLPLLERPRPTWALSKPSDNIPGRKFYVHHGGWQQVLQGLNPHTSQPIDPEKNNTTVQAAAENQSCEFDIFYENLDEHELGVLLYALELEPGLAHKMGMAKSCGFGSVTIQVTGVKERQAAGDWRQVNHTELDNLQQDALARLKEQLAGTAPKRSWEQMHEDFKKLFHFYQGQDVRYPPLEGDNSIQGYRELKKDAAYNPQQELSRPWTPWHTD